MKKIVSFLTSIALLLSLSACGTSPAPSGTNSGSTHDSATTPTTEAVVKIPEVTVPAPVIEPEGALGDVYVKITHFELFEDSNGYPSALIVYSFTNNSQESTAAMYKVSSHAYQNGVELPDASTYDLNDYDFGSILTEIQPGATIDIPTAYRLSSDTAPVEFEIVEDFSFYPSIVGEIFEICEGGETVLSQAPQGVMDFDVGSVHVSVVSYRITSDYNGAPVLVLEFGLTNNSTKSVDAGGQIVFQAFQNGIGLDTAYMVDGVDLHSRHAYLRPGAGVTAYCCFSLSDESPVDFELSELFSFDDTVYTFTIELE